jgi:hypothetical protein
MAGDNGLQSEPRAPRLPFHKALGVSSPCTARLSRRQNKAGEFWLDASATMRWLDMLPSIKKPDDTPNPEGWKPCPNCQANSATKSGFTWWGGWLGPKILTHVVCHACNTGYNGNSGRSNNIGIGVYMAVSVGVVVAIFSNM